MGRGETREAGWPLVKVGQGAQHESPCLLQGHLSLASSSLMNTTCQALARPNHSFPWPVCNLLQSPSGRVMLIGGSVEYQTSSQFKCRTLANTPQLHSAVQGRISELYPLHSLVSVASAKRLTCGIKWERLIEKLGMRNVRLVEGNGETGEDLASIFY